MSIGTTHGALTVWHGPAPPGYGAHGQRLAQVLLTKRTSPLGNWYQVHPPAQSGAGVVPVVVVLQLQVVVVVVAPGAVVVVVVH